MTLSARFENIFFPLAALAALCLALGCDSPAADEAPPAAEAVTAHLDARAEADAAALQWGAVAEQEASTATGLMGFRIVAYDADGEEITGDLFYLRGDTRATLGYQCGDEAETLSAPFEPCDGEYRSQSYPMDASRTEVLPDQGVSLRFVVTDTDSTGENIYERYHPRPGAPSRYSVIQYAFDPAGGEVPDVLEVPIRFYHPGVARIGISRYVPLDLYGDGGSLAGFDYTLRLGEGPDAVDVPLPLSARSTEGYTQVLVDAGIQTSAAMVLTRQ